MQEFHEYVDDCVFYIQSRFPAISEWEIIHWKDWDWINSTLDKINKNIREARRWELQCLVTSVAFAMGGEEASEGWKQLMDSLTTEEDESAAVEAEQEELHRKLEEDRRQRMLEMKGQAGVALLPSSQEIARLHKQNL